MLTKRGAPGANMRLREQRAPWSIRRRWPYLQTSWAQAALCCLESQSRQANFLAYRAVGAPKEKLQYADSKVRDRFPAARLCHQLDCTLARSIVSQANKSPALDPKLISLPTGPQIDRGAASIVVKLAADNRATSEGHQEQLTTSGVRQ